MIENEKDIAKLLEEIANNIPGQFRNTIEAVATSIFANYEAERRISENKRHSNEIAREEQETERKENEEERKENEEERSAVMGNLVEALERIKQLISGDSKYALDIAYPVGSVYMSFEDIAPSVLFGGSWEAIENGRFLRANNKASGTTGGTECHLHEMWMATANMNVDDVGNLNYKSGYSYNKDYMFMHYTYDKSVNLSTAAFDVQGEDFVGVQVTGITNDANSVPPYVTVYMWRRVA